MNVAVQQRLQRAWQALQGGRVSNAATEARAVAEAEPASFDAWRILGIAEHACGRSDAGNQAFLRALELRPGDAATALDLGTALLRVGASGQALPWLRRAVAGLPADARAAFRLGAAAYAQADLEAAIGGFGAATRLQPDWVEAWSNLAAAYGARQSYPDAIRAARRAAQLRPDDARVHLALAQLHSNLFDPGELRVGLQSAMQALQLEPSLAAGHTIAGVLYRKLGEPQRAEAHATRAVELQPTSAEAVEMLGEQQLLNGRPREAIETFNRAVARGVVTDVLRRQHGIAHLHAGDAEAALSLFEPLLQECPGDQRLVAHAGVALALARGAEVAIERLGLIRHVSRIPLDPPEGFPDSATFHAALADDIRRHSQQRWEPVGLAARSAYLSGDLLADQTAAIAGFERILRHALDAYIAGLQRDAADPFLRSVPDRYRLHVWATRASAQGYIDTHIHEDSWLSGAYYVELPPATSAGDRQGWIEFGRPYGRRDVPDAMIHAKRPVVGHLLVFPSYVFHRTLPYEGEGERISISFDLAAV